MLAQERDVEPERMFLPHVEVCTEPFTQHPDFFGKFEEHKIDEYT